MLQSFDYGKKEKEIDIDLEGESYKLISMESLGLGFVDGRQQVHLDKLWDIPSPWEILRINQLEDSVESIRKRLELSWKLIDALATYISTEISKVYSRTPFISRPCAF